MNTSTSGTASSGLLGNAYVLLIFTTLSWGGNAIAGRIAVGEISPLLLTTMRWVGVAILIALFARRAVAEAWPVLRSRLGFLAALGALGFTAFNALFYLAAQSTVAINIGIIQGAIPVFVMIGAYIVFRTPVTVVQVAGVAVTMVGVALVASHGDLSMLATLAFADGDLLMILACALYAGYTVALRRRPAVSGLAMFSVLAIAALVSSLPLPVIEAVSGTLIWPSAVGWAVLAYVVVFPSFVAQICFLRAVDLIGPARAGLFVNLVPIFAAGLGVVVLGEQFQVHHGLALGFVLGGIWLAERRRA
ncbi:MAG: DMT family transporter [Thalassobaculum sp.]|uniref:DMT family transporter n=1 Tax=Thalassobaculum sp. TaxID=2022740 RepID=UPI0032EF482F